MEPFRDDAELIAELRSLRPAPRPEFAAELDERAAAGFPRGSRSWKSRLAGLGDRVRAVPPRRMLAPAGAGILSAVVLGAVVVGLGGGPTNSTGPDPSGGGSTLSYLSRSSAEGEASSAATPSADGSNGARLSESASAIGGATASPSGPYASRAGRRKIERSAQIVLGTEAANIRANAAKVFDAVHVADGIVLWSSVRDGEEGEAGADFELLIPSAKLGDTLAALSGIAEVRSRRESTQDITAPTIGAREKLRDSRATIDGLLIQLAEASTDDERAAVEAKLRSERRRAAALRSRLSNLRRRANFSRVSVRIETGAAPAGESDGWGVSDGLDDAGRLLAVAAGVSVIALAILAPLALILLVAWLAHRIWVRSRRERALG